LAEVIDRPFKHDTSIVKLNCALKQHLFWQVRIVILIAGCLTLGAVGLKSAASPIQEDSWTALKTDDGILFIWNRPGLSFTLSVKGKDIRPLEGGENILFLVDGLVLQIQSLPIRNFVPEARPNKIDNKAILIAHRDWERKFIETELLHKKISVESESEKLSDGSDILIWQYDLPEGYRNPDAQKQVYATVVARDYLILLNSVVGATGSDAVTRRFLLEQLGTLKTSPDPIDVKKVQEAIRKTGKP
jgi:hypothetical protein